MVTVYWPFSKNSVDVKQLDNELSKENMLIIENIFRKIILLHQSQFEKHECKMSDVILKCHVYNIQMY